MTRRPRTPELTGPDETGVADDEDTDGDAGKIGSKARRGLAFSFLGIFITRIGSFAIGLILARLLSPADFGVYGIAVAAMAFAAYVNDGGIMAACVQWRGKFEDIAATGATIALSMSLLVYGAIFLAAPAFAAYSGAPEATPVVRLLTLVVVADGISAMRTAALVRRFEQGRLTQANVAGVLVNAAIAIPLGLSGAGAYSFAVGQLAGWIVMSAIVFKMGNLPLELGFDRSVAAKLIKFGLPLAVSLGVEAVLFNADYAIVGNLLGVAALGYYLIAFNVSTWVPGIVGTAVRYVAIPAFSRLAEQGKDELQAAVARSVPILVATILPVAVAIAILGQEMIVVVYGEKWAPAGVALQFLTILMVTRVLTSLALDILIATGFTKQIVAMNLGWAVVLIPALWFGTHYDGIRGTAIAHGVVSVFVALPLAVLTLRQAGVRLLPVMPALVRPVIGAIVLAAVILLITPLLSGGPLVELLVAGGAGVFAYTLVVVPLDQLRNLKARLNRRSVAVKSEENEGM